MTRSSVWAALFASMLLSGCADDASRFAGGTGSDLPRPTARLLDTNLRPLKASTWRLWKIEGDSVSPIHQIWDTAGFEIPGSGLWVVEAWADSEGNGAILGQAKHHVPQAVGGCPRNLTYISGGTRNGLGVQICPDLQALSSGGKRPVGIGVFGSAEPIQALVRITGHGIGAQRFLLWKVHPDVIAPRTEGPPTEPDRMLATRWNVRFAKIPGTVDVSVPTGLWFFEGWISPIGAEENWPDAVDSIWIPVDDFKACKANPDGICSGQPVQKHALAPDVDFVVEAP